MCRAVFGRLINAALTTAGKVLHFIGSWKAELEAQGEVMFYALSNYSVKHIHVKHVIIIN